MTAARVPLLLLVLLAVSCGDVPGEDAYEEGRYEEAHAALVETTEAESAPPEHLLARALAGLRFGNLPDAGTTLDRLDGEADPALAGFADFLRGNVAFARCEIAESQARTPEAEPFAFDIAISFGESARDAWRRAALSRSDWPEARRNVERALLKIEDLKAQKSARTDERKKERTPRPKIIPRPPDPTDSNPENIDANPLKKELSPEQVMALLEKLGEKEREKKTLRREKRAERMPEVEKDW